MNDVDIYKRVRGLPIQEFMAYEKGVQVSLAAHCLKMYAQAIIDQKHDTGNSYITMEHGDIDWYVTLHDPPGPHGGAPRAILVATDVFDKALKVRS